MDGQVRHWMKRPYFLDGNVMNTLSNANAELYNPFDFYHEGNRSRDNLHHIFASIDTNDPKQIVSFYNDYGPLGIKDETIDEFIRECLLFRFVLDQLNYIFTRDITSLTQLLEDKLDDLPVVTDTERLAIYLSLVVNFINTRLDGNVGISLTTNTLDLSVSRKLEWSFDSLLTAMYIMILMDIQRGVVSRSCGECGRYFETNRADIQYCSTKCQSRINTRRHLERKQKEESKK